jgi:hypothetical protein
MKTKKSQNVSCNYTVFITILITIIVTIIALILGWFLYTQQCRYKFEQSFRNGGCIYDVLRKYLNNEQLNQVCQTVSICLDPTSTQPILPCITTQLHKLSIPLNIIGNITSELQTCSS